MSDGVSWRLVDGTGEITIDRPARRNALNLAVKQGLVAAVQALEAEPGVSAMVLTGAGGCFVAGTDLQEMAEMRPSDHPRLKTDEVFHVLRHASKPVIAAVEGYALGGGCELALACDLIVAADDAQFGQPEVAVGIMPGAGGTQRLLRSAGRYQALLWCLTGQRFSAAQALAAHLVSEVVPSGQALARAHELARRLASMPPLAVQAIREVMRHGEGLPYDAALALERRTFERLFDTEDQREGMRAFLEKRPPHYKGR